MKTRQTYLNDSLPGPRKLETAKALQPALALKTANKQFVAMKSRTVLSQRQMSRHLSRSMDQT